MAAPAYLDASSEIVARALTGTLDTGGGAIRKVPDFFVPHTSAANFPWKSHALWYYSQMVRWGQVAASEANAAVAAASFRPDLYRAALAPTGAALPAADYKKDGTRSVAGEINALHGSLTMSPDLFFDGQVYDPDALDRYMASQRLTRL